jgi:excisionase family DNA binding protein
VHPPTDQAWTDCAAERPPLLAGYKERNHSRSRGIQPTHNLMAAGLTTPNPGPKSSQPSYPPGRLIRKVEGRNLVWCMQWDYSVSCTPMHTRMGVRLEIFSCIVVDPGHPQAVARYDQVVQALLFRGRSMAGTRTNRKTSGTRFNGARSGTREASPVLTLSEAAAFLRVSEEALLQLAIMQKVPTRQIGEDWRFSKTALQNWLGDVIPRKGFLSQIGALKDDPYREDLLREVYARRGRPETEGR